MRACNWNAAAYCHMWRPFGVMGHGGGQVVAEGEEYSASPFPDVRLQFEADDFGPRLSPLAVLPVGLFDCVL